MVKQRNEARPRHAARDARFSKRSGHGAWLLLLALGAVAACSSSSSDGSDKDPSGTPNGDTAADRSTRGPADESNRDGTQSGSQPGAPGEPGTSDSTQAAPAGKALVFNAPFTDTSQWTVGRTSSYPGATNPNDNKLDYISPSSGPDADGTFRATRRSDGKWDADLVTTEYSSKHFELKPNDELQATVTLGAEQGAWPAIWTWGRDLPGGVQPGHGEVDLFEYHTNNVDLLELSNHVSDTHFDYRNAANVKPGKPFELRVVFGSSSVDWYINGTRVFADGKGVPSNWVAYPIVNLSVAAGKYGHSAPSSSQTAMSYKVTNFRVYR